MGIQMDKFVARSGRVVKPGREDGSLVFANLSGYLDQASVFDAEEYFQAKQDTHLDRWRSKTDPTYVVYETHRAGVVVVLDEADGTTWFYHRDEVTPSASVSTSRWVALAYFAAHPPHQPWHDAQAGEFWLINHMGMQETCRVDDVNGTLRFVGVDGRGSSVSMPITHHSIDVAVRMLAEVTA